MVKASMRRLARKTQTGFTIIELLCVIAIILILVGLMIGPIMKAYKRAKALQESVN